jgi:hypothetical protein
VTESKIFSINITEPKDLASGKILEEIVLSDIVGKRLERGEGRRGRRGGRGGRRRGFHLGLH